MGRNGVGMVSVMDLRPGRRVPCVGAFDPGLTLFDDGEAVASRAGVADDRAVGGEGALGVPERCEPQPAQLALAC